MLNNYSYVILSGGLGNQMFQYAFALALRNRGYHVKMDASLYNYAQMHNGYELERVFGIDEKIVCKEGIHLLWLRFLMKGYLPLFASKDKACFSQQVLCSPQKYMFGYWQSECYFYDIEQDIRNLFSFKNIDRRNDVLGREMNNCNSVSIHIRRGDYESHGMTILEAEYYRKAIVMIKKKINSPVFYVFTDDTSVAKSILDSIEKQYQVIDFNRGQDSYKDMFLMSQCRHHIVANSSFSWWGAWLSQYPSKIVIAPSVWNNKNKMFHPQPASWVLI